MPEPADAARPLRVFHLCAPAYVGGLERVVQGLATGAAAQGHEVAVVSVIEPGQDVSAFYEPFAEAGVETITFEVPGRGYLKERRLVKALLAARRPDVLHTHGYRSDLLHGGTARRLGIAMVSTLHGSSRMGGASAIFEWIQERALRRLDGVVAVSRPLVDSLVEHGVAPECIHEVANAWTPSRHDVSLTEARSVLRAPADEVVLGWVGRLIPIKGCDVFVRALAEVKEGGWVARVVGDGPERPALEALAEELGIADRIDFLGAIPDAARYFHGFDLFVLSSRSEGTPMALLEAMGAGVAVAVTAVGGVPDVVGVPDDGWVVPPVDPPALAGAIDEALRDPAQRAVRAASGRERIHRQFDFDHWIRRHEEVYRAAMAVREKRR